MVPPRACPLNGKLEGSHVDDMNCLTLVSSNIVKSCLCTRLRAVVNPRKIGVCEYLERSRGDRDVSPDWNEAGKTKIPDLFVGKGCPYYFPTPFCQDLHPLTDLAVRRSEYHEKLDDVLP